MVPAGDLLDQIEAIFLRQRDIDDCQIRFLFVSVPFLADPDILGHPARR